MKKATEEKRMVDYIALLVIGLTLFIGFFPLLFKRFRGGDFLVSHIDSRDGRVVTQEEIKNYKKNKK